MTTSIPLQPSSNSLSNDLDVDLDSDSQHKEQSQPHVVFADSDHISQPAPRRFSGNPPFLSPGAEGLGIQLENERDDREEGGEEGWDSDFELDADELNHSMAASRPPMHRPTDGRSHQPLLNKDEERGRPSYDSPNGSARPTFAARRSTFRSRSPGLQAAEAKSQTRRKYTYAAFFLVLSLISFTIQTETAVYIQHELHWEKAYCML